MFFHRAELCTLKGKHFPAELLADELLLKTHNCDESEWLSGLLSEILFTFDQENWDDGKTSAPTNTHTHTALFVTSSFIWIVHMEQDQTVLLVIINV